MKKVDEFIKKLKYRLSVVSDCKLRIKKDNDNNILRIYIISNDGDKSYCYAISYLEINNAYNMDVFLIWFFSKLKNFI